MTPGDTIMMAGSRFFMLAIRILLLLSNLHCEVMSNFRFDLNLSFYYYYNYYFNWICPVSIADSLLIAMLT